MLRTDIVYFYFSIIVGTRTCTCPQPPATPQPSTSAVMKRAISRKARLGKRLPWRRRRAPAARLKSGVNLKCPLSAGMTECTNCNAPTKYGALCSYCVGLQSAEIAIVISPAGVFHRPRRRCATLAQTGANTIMFRVRFSEPSPKSRCRSTNRPGLRCLHTPACRSHQRNRERSSKPTQVCVCNIDRTIREPVVKI